MLWSLIMSCSLFGPSAGPRDDVPTVDPTDGTGDSCGMNLLTTHPVDGTSDFYYRDTISASFDGVSSTPWLALDGPDGLIDGTQTVDGTTVVFTPDSPLSPTSAYTAVATWCEPQSSASWSFQTSGGDPPDEPVLVGRSFLLEFSDGRWPEPSGFGEVLLSGTDMGLLMGVLETTDQSWTVQLATSIDGHQDLCTETHELSVNTLWPPYIAIELPDLRIPTSLGDVTLVGGYLIGTLSDDSAEINAVSISGEFDLRLSTLLGEELPQDQCDVLSGLGWGCEPCADGLSFCLSAQATDLDFLDTELEVEPVDAGDCD